MSMKRTSLDKMSSVPLMNLNDRRNASHNHDSDQYWSDQEIEEFSRDPLENVLNQMRLWPQAITRQQCARSVAFAGSICLCIGFTLGYILFMLLNSRHLHNLKTENDSGLSKKFLDDVNPVNIGDFLRNLIDELSTAESSKDTKWNNHISQIWKEQGLDSIHTVPYKVLLSFPNKDKLNKLELLETKTVFNVTSKFELETEEDASSIIDISAAEETTGNLVYVNYGSINDYLILQKNNITTTGTIALIRMGGIDIVEMVNNAKLNKISAVILYPDPKDYPESALDNVNPIIWSSGSLNSFSKNKNFHTSQFPANDLAFQLHKKEIQGAIAGLPFQAVNYEVAEKLFSLITNELAAPPEWEGNLNIKYKIGKSSQKIKMTSNNVFKIIEMKNTIGIITGKVESDRYILIGGHHDLLTHEANEHLGGTAVLLEITRGFGKLIKEGWHPRRSLVFCSWSASAYSPTGSSAWAKMHSKVLIERAVAYLNLDNIIQGYATLQAVTVPSMQQMLYDVTKAVPGPSVDKTNTEGKTTYDLWLQQSQDSSSTASESKFPRISYPLMNEDYSSFIHVLGIPIVDVQFINETDLSFDKSSPIHHTNHETLDKLDFKYHTSIAQIYGLIAIKLADSTILPFNTEDYAKLLDEKILALKNRSTMETMKKKSINFDLLDSTRNLLLKYSNDFHKEINNIDKTNSLSLRDYNDRLMQLERNFIEPCGLSCLPEFNHMVFAYDITKPHLKTSFACIDDLLDKLETGAIEENTEINIQKEIEMLDFYMKSAISILQNDPFQTT